MTVELDLSIKFNFQTYGQGLFVYRSLDWLNAQKNKPGIKIVAISWFLFRGVKLLRVD